MRNNTESADSETLARELESEPQGVITRSKRKIQEKGKTDKRCKITGGLGKSIHRRRNCKYYFLKRKHQ